MDRDGNAVLFVSGIPACGKSVLTNFVKTRLESKLDEDQKLSLIVSFFFDRSTNSLREPHVMLRSLLHDMLDQQNCLFPHFQRVFEHPGGSPGAIWSIEDLKTVLDNIRSHPAGLTVYLLLDSVDESNAESECLSILEGFLKGPDDKDCAAEGVVVMGPGALNADLPQGQRDTTSTTADTKRTAVKLFFASQADTCYAARRRFETRLQLHNAIFEIHHQEKNTEDIEAYARTFINTDLMYELDLTTTEVDDYLRQVVSSCQNSFMWVKIARKLFQDVKEGKPELFTKAAVADMFRKPPKTWMKRTASFWIASKQRSETSRS